MATKFFNEFGEDITANVKIENGRVFNEFGEDITDIVHTAEDSCTAEMVDAAVRKVMAYLRLGRVKASTPNDEVVDLVWQDLSLEF